MADSAAPPLAHLSVLALADRHCDSAMPPLNHRKKKEIAMMA